MGVSTFVQRFETVGSGGACNDVETYRARGAREYAGRRSNGEGERYASVEVWEQGSVGTRNNMNS